MISQQQQVRKNDNTSTMDDPEAATAVGLLLLPVPPEEVVSERTKSDKQELMDDNNGRSRQMEAFEIEMGDDNDATTTTTTTNISKEEEVSEIPSITTAISMDESIDEDIVVEMESLLRNGSPTTKKHRSTSTIANGANETTSTTMNGGTASTTTMSHIKNSLLQRYRCGCCCSTSDSNAGSSKASSSVSSTNTTATTTTTTNLVSKPYRMGNIYVIYPPIYIRTNGWFVIGPHWFGPPFILFLVVLASYYIIYVRCYQRQWYLTMTTCLVLCGSTIYHLINTAYRDPGVIVKQSLPINHADPTSIPRSYRYCDTCQYYQPSHAAHCPDCNVCVAGFDHHCVWMSICIGVGNYKPFMRFNLSWLAYVVYAVVWVAVIAPIFD